MRGDRGVDLPHSVQHAASQVRPATQPGREHVVRQLEIVHLQTRHLLHVHIVAGRVQRIGVERFPQEPGGPALAHHVALLKRPREHHEGQHRLRGGPQADEVRTEVWKVFRARRLQLPRGADLVRRIAGHHLIDGGGMIEQPVGRVAQGANQRRFIELSRELRQDLRDADAGDVRGDRLKGAADVVRHVLLGIPQVEMTGTALEIDENDAFRPVPAGRPAAAPAAFCVLGALRGAGLEVQHRPQREPQHPGSADPQQIASGAAGAPWAGLVAEVFAAGAGEDEHRGGAGGGETDDAPEASASVERPR